MPYSTSPFPEGKKISCTVAPLAHTGLKRIPEQVYLGKILRPLTQGNETQYIFATPHGLLLHAKEVMLQELTADQYKELEQLENDATAREKMLYGGEVGLKEFSTLPTTSR